MRRWIPPSPLLGGLVVLGLSWLVGMVPWLPLPASEILPLMGATDERLDARPAPTTLDQGSASRGVVASRILTVKLAFKAEPRLFSHDLEVEETSQGLRLSGTVGTEADRLLAEHIARSAAGALSITNDLTIDPAVRQEVARRRDAFITRQVEQAFAKSTTLSAANFAVTTRDGIVFVRGATRFQVLLLEAAEAAAGVPGVKAVNTQQVRLTAGGD